MAGAKQSRSKVLHHRLHRRLCLARAHRRREHEVLARLRLSARVGCDAEERAHQQAEGEAAVGDRARGLERGN